MVAAAWLMSASTASATSAQSHQCAANTRCAAASPKPTGLDSTASSFVRHQSITTLTAGSSEASITGTCVEPHPAGRAVDGHRLHLPDRVKLELGRPDHAGLVHRARHHRRVAGRAAGLGQDADRLGHAGNVVRVRLMADEDAGSLQLAASSAVNTGRPVTTPGQAGRPVRSGLTLNFGSIIGRRIVLNWSAVSRRERRLVVDHAFLDEVGGDPEGGAGAAACRRGTGGRRARPSGR